MRIETLTFALSGGHVKRYHTWSMLENQKINSHSFEVAMICWWLTSGVARTQLIMAALCHDLAEQTFGDIPAPAKRAMPGWGDKTFREAFGELEAGALSDHYLWFEDALREDEARILKLADAADGCLHCIRERVMGNKLITPCWNNFIAYYSELSEHPREETLRKHLIEEWNKANG